MKKLQVFTFIMVSMSLCLPFAIGQDKELKENGLPTSRQEWLEDVEWLVGTWKGTGELPGQGEVVDTLVFKWILDKAFIQIDSTLRLGDKVIVQKTGIIGWDSDVKKTIWNTYDSEGKISYGIATNRTGKMTNYDIHLSGADVKTWQQTGIQIDQNTFTMAAFMLRENKKIPVMTLTYKRKSSDKNDEEK